MRHYIEFINIYREHILDRDIVRLSSLYLSLTYPYRKARYKGVYYPTTILPTQALYTTCIAFDINTFEQLRIDTSDI
ncbi:hypothetical protein B0A54_16887, partial [Friedmanniomyces endolithicus]